VAKKKRPKVQAVEPKQEVWPVRLVLDATDHARLEAAARVFGLTKSAYAKLALFERIEADEKGRKG
jgi:hypothetical protein